MAEPVYLDNSATTRPFDEVINAMAQAMAQMYYNPSSLYEPGLAVERAMGQVREQTALLAGCPGWDVIFTSGGTEANNLALRGVAGLLPPGRRRILTSAVEHPSVTETLKLLERDEYIVEWLPVDSSGVLQPECLAQRLGPDVGLVSIMDVNNETGAVMPWEELAPLVRLQAPQALLHADGVQAFGKLKGHAARMDLYTVSGHKIHGPKGIGALFLRPGTGLRPLILGGGQERGLRSGTENTPGILGLGCAASIYLARQEEFISAMTTMKARLAAALLAADPEAVINGPAPERGAPHILNMSFPGLKAEVLLHALEAEGIFVSTGSACSSHKKGKSPVLTAMRYPAERIDGALRFSLSPMNTPEEMDRTAEVVARQASRLRRFGRKR